MAKKQRKIDTAISDAYAFIAMFDQLLKKESLGSKRIYCESLKKCLDEIVEHIDAHEQR